ncbi:uncharacterized protein LOC134685667 isoform X1 [Mytilus trossulus]|uniref:uncharacterized protein LOC134685667 isoform X1 n=2 Tax=Mytilus trossulus TaxID=6551 RepID=UPI0030040FF0
MILTAIMEMHQCLWRCIYLIIVLQLIEHLRADQREEDARRLMESLNQAQTDISSMMSTVDGLDNYLTTQKKRACNLGLNSHHCALADLDNQLQSREWLSNGHSPGKRTTLKEEHKEKLSEVEIKRLIEDIVRKRLDLKNIRTLLEDANGSIIENSKRTCTVELGGACRTEWASSIADQYYYLMSPHSPGRKRRSFRKRMSPLRLFHKRLQLIKKRHSNN